MGQVDLPCTYGHRTLVMPCMLRREDALFGGARRRDLSLCAIVLNLGCQMMGKPHGDVFSACEKLKS